MYPDRDFDPQQDLRPNEPDLASDLELEVLLRAMAGRDTFLASVARPGLHSQLADPAEIVYRQRVLADCIARPDVVRELYAVALAAVTGERHVLGYTIRDSPETIMYRCRTQMLMYLDAFRRLRKVADAHAAEFTSDGLTRFFAMIARELDDAYLAEVETQLDELGFRRGMLISARLGAGLKGAGYVLRRLPEQTWRDRIPGLGRGDGFTFYVPERDENGLRALSDLSSRGLNGAANALAQSADHVRSFFALLRAELGFYLGCLNLRERLAGLGAPVCFPVPAEVPAGAAPSGRGRLSARGLYDACLALNLGAPPVGNDLDADGKHLVIVTGANQGGKSTFLRSLGLAQLMMQAGMFVAADSFQASTSTGIFTHFKREEDAAMEKGKLDEELERMSAIADQIAPGGLLLANESFASTNEREGSELARQVIRALTEAGIRVVFVTHLYDLAGGLYAGQDPAALFLRAEREPDGRRTFLVRPGEPLPTSYGQDLYDQVFQAGRAVDASR